MLTGVTALAGVLVGAVLTLATAGYLDRKHSRHREQLRAAEEKRAAYRAVLSTLDELFGLRPDHPEVGHLVRALTGQITDLQLVAPPQLADLAGQCVSIALEPNVDPVWVADLRRQFTLAARADLHPENGGPVSSIVLRPPERGTARHAVARHAR